MGGLCGCLGWDKEEEEAEVEEGLVGGGGAGTG